MNPCSIVPASDIFKDDTKSLFLTLESVFVDTLYFNSFEK